VAEVSTSANQVEPDGYWAGMSPTQARAVMAVLGVVIALMAAIGVVLLAVTPAVLAVVTGFGAVAGVVVGVGWRWSGDRDVRAADLPRYGGAGMLSAFSLQGAASVGAELSLVVVLLLVGWGLAAERAARHGSSESGHPVTARPQRARRWVVEAAEHCDELPVERLHELWEQLRPSAAAGLDDHRLVELRSRVLDALSRRDPEGYSTWLRTDAPDNVSHYVGRARAVDDDGGHEPEPT
jgi:hypothetical protein